MRADNGVLVRGVHQHCDSCQLTTQRILRNDRDRLRILCAKCDAVLKEITKGTALDMLKSAFEGMDEDGE